MNKYRMVGMITVVLLGMSCQVLNLPGGFGIDPGSTRIRDVDGMVEVYVPAGKFLMGSSGADPEAEDDEFPQHEVYLDAYWIDRTEVTNAQFAALLNKMGNQEEGGATWLDTWGSTELEQVHGEWQVGDGYEDHPVVEVTWYGAASYCGWVGGRLPTEAEWEKAARGTDERRYPWGNEDPTCSLANHMGCEGERRFSVGSFPDGASPYGALDMAGNVWEWVADWYYGDYYDHAPDEIPMTCVLRGGSWLDSPAYLRTADRSEDYPNNSMSSHGFRCVRSP